MPLKLWDVNPSAGGPIVLDKLWFFATYRYQINRQSVASMWVNANAGDPTKWTYQPDLTQQAVDDGTWKNGSLRLTWQPTPRNKINAWSDLQYICLHCIEGGSSSGLSFTGVVASPEALQRNENHPNSMSQVTWTSPVTNKLLLEANVQMGPYFYWGSRTEHLHSKKPSCSPPRTARSIRRISSHGSVRPTTCSPTEDGGEVLHGPVRDDDEHRQRMAVL